MTHTPNTLEERFDEKFTYKDGGNKPRPEVCNGTMWDELKSFINSEIQKAMEEGYKKGQDDYKEMIANTIEGKVFKNGKANL